MPRAHAVAPPRDRRAREVERAAGGVEHHLDDVRVGEVGRARRSHARRCSSRSRALRASSAAQASISAGSISGSSPWTLTTIVVVGQAEQRAGLGQAVAAAGVVGARQQRLRRRARAQAATMRASSAATTTRARRRLRRALRDAHHHRQAADVGQRLVGQPRRRQPRRDQDGEASRVGAPARLVVGRACAPRSSSITGMPSRTGKARRSAWQTSSWRSCCGGRAVLQRPLAERADQQFKQSVCPCGHAAMAWRRAGAAARRRRRLGLEV